MAFDAVVIGAGPAGAVAARSLAGGGWRVALVEKSEFPRAKVCGEFLSAPSLDVLDGIGIGDAFRRQAGPPVTRIGLFSGETRVTAKAPRAPYGRALHRAALDTLLRDAAVAAGATLFQPCAATSVRRDGENWTVALESGATLATPVLVAASGSWRVTPPFA
ncbi:MAG TPA: FAD-dependent monooxygenase, partial [Rhizomicrobium sp.]|nr:FAD-dependent monooxygenase [Rhizomicrobium sp.]